MAPPASAVALTGRLGPAGRPAAPSPRRRRGPSSAAGRCEREASALAAQLATATSRRRGSQITHLVGRDPTGLDADELARACVESVAENTSDAVVAPLFWGAVAGVPGLLGYRAANTLDAMVGHRSPRYLRFGWAAARLDDVAQLGPGPARGPR